MEFFHEYFNFKEKLTGRNLKILILSLVIGLLMMSIFNGKCRVDLQTVAVSSDEQYIACFETGKGFQINCYSADGSLAFHYDILPDISSGGFCTLWFEDDTLCALFYRTEKIVYFSPDGTIIKIADQNDMEAPPTFPSFFKERHRYVFDGNQIDVVYDKCTFLGYWLFGAERYLAITPKNGETKIVYSWTAEGGITEKVD